MKRKEFVREYKGYDVWWMGDALNIYDKNGEFVKRVNSLVIRVAERAIDEIIERGVKEKV